MTIPLYSSTIYYWTRLRLVLENMSFYAVKVGKLPGVYTSWEECAKQVHKFPKAVYKKFSTMSAAKQFISHPTYSYKNPKKKITLLQSSNIHSSAYPKLSSSSKIHSEGAGASAYPELKSKITPKIKDNLPDPLPLSGCDAYVYTDGSCISNGVTASAKAGMGVFWGNNSEDNISKRLEKGEQTNSRAELLAIAIALKQGISKNIKRLEVRSDSNYAINSCSKWLKKWATNGWKLSNNNKVSHKDVLLDIKKLMSDYDSIKWTHIPAHKGYHGNEMADELAKKGAVL